MADAKLARAQEHVAACMDDILTAFKPGVKITVMIRNPSEPQRDFMMTSDTIPELRAMLDRREAESTTIPTAEQQKAQGARCGCKGFDDYCPCQNIVTGARNG